MIPAFVQETKPPESKPLIFANRSDEELLNYGVPKEWLADVKQANEREQTSDIDHKSENEINIKARMNRLFSFII